MTDSYYSNDFGSLYCGDAIEILPKLNVRPDLIITSPPYDNLRDYGGHEFDFENMARVLTEIMPIGGALVWVVGDATINGSETGTSFRQVLYFMSLGLRLHDTMIFEKSLLKFIKNEPRYANAMEYMFVLSKEKPKTFNPIMDRPNIHAGLSHRRTSSMRTPDGEQTKRGFYGERVITKSHSKRSNIWRYATGHLHSAPDYKQAHEHPAIFPYQLAYDHILSWSNENDLILDPMFGSGTVLKAAKDLNRRYIGVEIHEPYCELAMNRLKIETIQ